MAVTSLLCALNDQVRDSLLKMVKDLSDEQIKVNAPVIDLRPITGVATHAYGSLLMLANAMAGDGWEGMPKIASSTTDLISMIEETHEKVDVAFTSIPAQILDQPITMPWGKELGGYEAIAITFAHTLIHIGNIQGIRAAEGFPT
jgi:hypothetical protein